jgi:hypothetical protein
MNRRYGNPHPRQFDHFEPQTVGGRLGRGFAHVALIDVGEFDPLARHRLHGFRQTRHLCPVLFVAGVTMSASR